MKEIIIALCTILIIGLIIASWAMIRCQQKIAKLRAECSDSEIQIWKMRKSDCSVVVSERDLLAIAEHCANDFCDSIIAEILAIFICRNPATTGKVIKELIQSNWFSVWNVVARYEYAEEEDLIELAKNCAKNVGDRFRAETLATNICKNLACTKKVIKELLDSTWYSVWNIALETNYADEEVLIEFAKSCAKLSQYEAWAKTIATSICESSAITVNVVKELENSEFASVKAIASVKMEELQ